MYRIIVSLIIAGLTIISALANVLRVPTQYPTIQAGINAAVDGDTVLVAVRTYTGEGNRNLDFIGKSIVLKSESGPETCSIIGGNSNYSCFNFHCNEDSNSIVEGFTITDFRVEQSGAGIRCIHSSPTFKHCIIADNEAYQDMFWYYDGGGVYALNSSPIFIRCTFYNNRGNRGGGVFAENSDFVVNSCIFVDNESNIG